MLDRVSEKERRARRNILLRRMGFGVFICLRPVQSPEVSATCKILLPRSGFFQNFSSVTVRKGVGGY